MKYSILSLCLLTLMGGIAHADEVDTITVYGHHNTFHKPTASSYRSPNMQGGALHDKDALIRSVPGTFTQHDIGQAGVDVTIRGLDGLGRVNMMVDGMPQTSVQTNPAHGFNGVVGYIDPNFISGVEIDRGYVSGNAGANALAGSVNYHTVNADDILVAPFDPNKKIGGRLILRGGSNGYGQNGMFAVAARFGKGWSALAAGTFKEKYGYKNAAGEVVASSLLHSNVQQESRIHNRSTLLNLRFHPNNQQDLQLTRLGNNSTFINDHAPLFVNNRSWLIRYHINPLSDLVNAHLQASTTTTTQTFIDSSDGFYGKKVINRNYNFKLSNTSIVQLSSLSLPFTYGASYLHNRYIGFITDSGTTVSGIQNTQDAFIDTNIAWKKLLVSLGVRYEHYNIKGLVPSSDIATAYHFSTKESSFNPHLGFAYDILPSLQIFGSISHSSRSPSVHEVMYDNNASTNPFSINPDLKPETAFNREIGLNINKEGLLTHADTLNIKVDYFNNKIHNYIVRNQFYLCGTTICGYNDGYDSAVGIYQNVRHRTYTKGWEVEGQYDAGVAYVNVVWSRTRQNFPVDFLVITGFDKPHNLPKSVWSVDLGTRLFNQKLTIGTTLNYDGSDTTPSGYDDQKDGRPLVTTNPPTPILVNLYTVYRPSSHLAFYANVNNLTNRIYNYPLSAGTMGVGNNYGTEGRNEGDWVNQGTGRGRTYYAGVQLNF